MYICVYTYAYIYAFTNVKYMYIYIYTYIYIDICICMYKHLHITNIFSYISKFLVTSFSYLIEFEALEDASATHINRQGNHWTNALKEKYVQQLYS